MKTFLQSGGTKSSRWKPSSKLEEQNHRGGNAPAICRTFPLMFFLVMGFAGRFR
jgi:hypothetical protein